MRFRLFSGVAAVVAGVAVTASVLVSRQRSVELLRNVGADSSQLSTLIAVAPADSQPAAVADPMQLPLFTVVWLADAGEFGGLAFGCDLTLFDGVLADEHQLIMPRRTYVRTETLWYQRVEDPTQVDGVNCEIYYGFANGRFVEAVVIPREPSDGIKLLGLLEDRYTGKRVNSETWLWVGEQIGIDFSGYCSLEECGASFVYVFPRKRVIFRRET